MMMTSTNPPHLTTEALQQALIAQMEMTRDALQMLDAERKAAAAERGEARREIARLVTMVEGLTLQLDALLKENQDEQREKLKALREEAKAALEAANARKASEPDEPVQAPEPSRTPPKRDSHGRNPIPANIPRDVVKKKPDACPNCGGALDEKKVLTSEEWHYIRAHLRAKRTERTLCKCRDCNQITVPEQDPMPFERVACTFAMMAWLCFAKVGLFLPLDRLQRDFADQGAHLASSTLTRWWQRGADLLLPIATSVRMALLAGTHIRTDGTGLKVVFPRVKGKPVKGDAREGEVDADGYLLPRLPNNGQILVFGNDERAVFHYTPTKHGYQVLDFFTLGEAPDGTPILWKGTITADAISSHNLLFWDGDRVEAGCNAHGLRKFRDDAEKAPLLASRALGFIDRFYSEEARARDRGLTGAALLSWRQEHIGPVAAQFKEWLSEHLSDLLPSHPIRKAMQYYLNHWSALTRFLFDPAVELDNNWSERALRSIALLRNNSLYAGGEEGAVRLCTLLTLITTCRLLQVNPYEYLEWALSKVVPHRLNRGLLASDLTPAAYKSAQQSNAQ